MAHSKGLFAIGRSVGIVNRAREMIPCLVGLGEIKVISSAPFGHNRELLSTEKELLSIENVETRNRLTLTMAILSSTWYAAY